MVGKTKFLTFCVTPKIHDHFHKVPPLLRTHFIEVCRHSLQPILLLWIQAVQINVLDKSVFNLLSSKATTRWLVLMEYGYQTLQCNVSNRARHRTWQTGAKCRVWLDIGRLRLGTSVTAPSTLVSSK